MQAIQQSLVLKNKIRVRELAGATIIFVIVAVSILNSPPSLKSVAATKEYDRATTRLLEEVCKNLPQGTCKDNYEQMHEECFDSKYEWVRQYLTICSDPRIIPAGSRK